MTTALLLKIGAESSALRGDLDKSNRLVNQFTSKIGAAGLAIAGAFSVSAVANFVMEVSKLSAEAQGVRYAFEKLGGSTKLLHDLKEATHGTVSELELMKNAVAFKNFNLDIAQLPKLLQFATMRAQQTGQSVDYLVQSIVTGLGRKSVLILDNLGISAATLNAEIEKTGDFFGAVGTIVDQEIGNMGEHIENNISKTDRLKASWTNFQVAVGDAANETGVLGKVLDSISARLDILASKDVPWWRKGQFSEVVKPIMDEAEQKRITEEQRKQAVTIEIATEAVKKYKGNLEEIVKAYKDIGGGQEVIAEATKMINGLNDQTAKTAPLIENETNLREQLNKKQAEAAALIAGPVNNALRDEIRLIQKKIKALQDATAAAERQPQVKNLAPIQKNDIGSIGGNNMPAINTGIDGLKSEYEELSASVVAANQRMWASGQQFTEGQMFMAQVATSTAEAIMESIGSVANGQQSALRAIASVTSQIVDMFAKRAIAAAIANAAANPGAPFPLASVIAATVAAGAMKALLGRVGVRGGGGGGGSGAGGSSSPGSLTRIKYGERLEVSGTLKMSGRDMVATLENETRAQGRTRA